jgi:hypothetical protein
MILDTELKVISAKRDESVGVTETTKMKYQDEQKKILGLFKYDIIFETKGEKREVLLVKPKTHYKDFSCGEYI